MAEIVQMPVAADLDQMAVSVRDGLARMRRAEDDWAEAAIETCRALHEARSRFSHNKAFGEWCETNGFGPDVFNKDDRAAAIEMGKNLRDVEPILRKTNRRSLQTIRNNELSVLNVKKTSNNVAPELDTKSKKRTSVLKADADNVKLTRDIFERIAAKLINGVPQEDAVDQINADLPDGESISIQPVKIVAGYVRVMEPDPADFPSAQAVKVERAIRVARITLRAEIEAEVREEHKRWFEQVYLPLITEKNDRADRIIAAYKGFMPRAMYRKILGCLHPDGVDEERKERFAEAFQAFRALEPVLVKPDQEKGRDGGLPKTLAEMMARRKVRR